ncbi:MAG: cytochrome c [Alphaproteobacteria bacterium]|nr:cytochrome c [Alphaproteobacteria bacterium]MCB9693501.1 cytochrome c [Alphaproteobacteria bacterium]
MNSATRTTARVVGVFGFLALTSTVAFGLPWDVDMADAQTVKAYEYRMSPLPEGVVPHDSMLNPTPFVENYALGSAEGKALINPVPSGAEHLALGKKMYDTYCTPCHGDGQQLGKVSEAGYPGIAILAGGTGRLQKLTDGDLYLTVRNGRGLMPAYSWAMNDTEMWSLVRHLRTLPNGAYVPPPPPAPEEAPQ